MFATLKTAMAQRYADTLKKPLEFDSRLLAMPQYLAMREDISRGVRDLQEARTAEDFFRAHLSILGGFGHTQTELRTAFEQKEAAELRVRELAQAKPKDIAAIKAAQAELTEAENFRQMANASLAVAAEVADGLVWKALRCSRPVIAPLGQGANERRLSEGIGFGAEFDLLQHLWEDEQTFAIATDITNALRVGDLAIFRRGVPVPRDGSGLVEFMEVKAGQSGRDPESPQMQRVRRTTTLAKEGIIQDYEGTGATAAFTPMPFPHDNVVGYLPAVREAAREHAVAMQIFGGALAVQVVDVLRLEEIPQSGGELSEQAARALGWTDKPVSYTMGLHRRMRSRRDPDSDSAPPSIFPMPPEMVGDYLLGYVDILTIVRLDYLVYAAGKLDIELEIRDNVAHAARRGAHINLPLSLILDEYMLPDCWVRMVDVLLQFLEPLPKDFKVRPFVGFAYEDRTWFGEGW